MQNASGFVRLYVEFIQFELLKNIDIGLNAMIYFGLFIS